METLNAQVIEMLRKECKGTVTVSAYMKHVIIELAERVSNEQFAQQKEEITALIGRYFPERNDDLPITIMTADGSKEQDIFIKKTNR